MSNCMATTCFSAHRELVYSLLAPSVAAASRREMPGVHECLTNKK